jgi:hypothetical protein
MYDLHRELIETLAATPETLAGLLRGVDEAQARSAIGGDENWSVIEVICHLRDAEEIGFGRMQAMRDQDKPLVASWDQNALALEKKYAEADLAPALTAFTKTRSEYVAALKALKPEQWERVGKHNETGDITVLTHALHRTYHDAIHCAQIARQLLI